MNAVAYKCPACGSYLTDDEEHDILVCPHCGISITKETTEYDKSLRYLRERDAREREERKNIFQAIYKAENRSTISLALILIGCVIFGITAHYLGI